MNPQKSELRTEKLFGEFLLGPSQYCDLEYSAMLNCMAAIHLLTCHGTSLKHEYIYFFQSTIKA